MNFSKANKIFALILFVILSLVFIGYLDWIMSQSRLSKMYNSVQKSIAMPAGVVISSSSYTSYSQQGLPHYAPFSEYSFSYLRSNQQQVHADVLAEMRTNGFTINGTDATSGDLQMNFDWRIDGTNLSHTESVMFQASGTIITEKICKPQGCY
jgi:hypothetical protein